MDNTQPSQQAAARSMDEVAVAYSLSYDDDGKAVATFSVKVDGGMLHAACEVENPTAPMLGHMAGCITDHLKAEQVFFPGADMTERTATRSVHVGSISDGAADAPHFVPMDVEFYPDEAFED